MRLIAYVVPRGDADISHADLDAHARRRLPDYMVPATYVTLPAMPFTPNGKLDRRALPVPAEPQLDDSYVPPRTPTEQLLAKVWADVLGVERVGAHDDFFRLGGHSLLAGELVARAREALARDIPLRLLFAGPTVAQMAAALDARSGASESPPAAAVRRPAAEVLADY